MAQLLAQLYGTDRDKVNCTFYTKIGACRHGDECTRQHIQPPFSQIIRIISIYQEGVVDFDQFYQDLWIELSLRYGKVEEMIVCENLTQHLTGNVFVRFSRDAEAQAAVDGLNERFYNGYPVYAELSPVTDFWEARCRSHDSGKCQRLCNFMHVRKVDPTLVQQLRESPL